MLSLGFKMNEKEKLKFIPLSYEAIDFNKMTVEKKFYNITSKERERERERLLI